MVTLPRYIDWPTRLAAALESRRNVPFKWGENDCAIFAADMVEAITGHNFATPFRGRYKTLRGSKTMLRNMGWKDLEDLADTFLPRQTGPIQRGDLVLYDGRYGAFLGVYFAGAVYGPAERGFEAWPADESILAIWKVG